MIRRAQIVMIVMTVLIVAATIRLSYKVEQTNMRINRIVDEMQRCGRVYLMSPREDVIQAMGQPVRTEVVPSVVGGLADRLWYQYRAIKIDRNPYIDVDRHFNKVVAIDCAFSRHDLRTVVRKGQMQMPKDQPLPTDRKRY